MKILIAHTFYKQPGGEDQCVAAEVAMLKAHGHQVMQYFLHNDSTDTMSRVRLATRTIWSRMAYRELRQLLKAHRPQIAHFHNTFPLISPAAYYAAQAEDVRVVQTLHNFRLFCVNALLFRDGAVCETCLGRTIPWAGIAHGCYRKSHTASATIAAMVTAHRALGTWRNAVDMYIALSESSRCKFVAGGISADKIAIKPNFACPDPGPGAGRGGYAIYVGRLSEEKGIETLLSAWRHRGAPPLKLVGDGPMSAVVEEAAAHNPAIQWLRGVSHDRVFDLLGDAAFLVVPSQCHETFGRVVMEAFAKGTPVIVSKLGAMAEIVDDGHDGLHFQPGNSADLFAKVQSLLADPLKLSRMRHTARHAFEQNFTAEANHKMLMAIYERALISRAPAKRAAPSMAPRYP